jgi:hypothetical protein
MLPATRFQLNFLVASFGSKLRSFTYCITTITIGGAGGVGKLKMWIIVKGKHQ